MRDEIVIALVILLVIASAGAGYFVGSQATISTKTTTSTAFVSTTLTLTKASTTTATGTGVNGGFPPFVPPVYLTTRSGHCSENGTFAPCMTSNPTEADVFNCGAAWLSGVNESMGCFVRLGSGVSITVWLTGLNLTSGFNCRFNDSGETWQGSGTAYCQQTNSTAFIMMEPGVPLI